MIKLSRLLAKFHLSNIMVSKTWVKWVCVKIHTVVKLVLVGTWPRALPWAQIKNLEIFFA